ncbi:MAG: filamentous hemagglutinin N-terminal domain-containing protein, partial [Rubripirellula sp.]|nr:filamentous hemagglutinin N-terminal domain-containing protein [Rubripirellula sp.]
MVMKLNRRKLQGDASVPNGASWNRTSSRNGVTKKKLFVGVQIFLLLMQNSVAFADPGGGTVVVGSASIQQSGSTRTIQQFSDRAVINWQDFSIQQGETTRFIQPNSSSAVLNRVTGGNPSAILGTLEANGNVFLVNPNGIVVGAGARINVNGLVASTLELSDANFMLGSDYQFEGNSNASVINEGAIKALGGDIYLLGSHVENHGTLQAENGTVGLGAGQSIRIVDSNFPSLVVRATAESLGGTGIVNTGLISATQAELVANGGNVYGLAINNEGIVRASGSEIRGGRVFLISDGGTIRSSGDLVAKRGQNGGDVIIHAGGQSGSEIEILGTIDVSGDDYGGTVGMKAASILLGGATVNLQGGIVDGVRLISLGSSSAEIVDPTNSGFLDFSDQDGVTSVVDNANQIQVSDVQGLSVNDSIITSDEPGFVDLQITAADADQFISFITFDLDGGTTSPDATVTFEVKLQKPSGATEIVVLEAKFSELTDNKVAIKATGGDLIKAITFNSNSNGVDGHAFICEVKTGDVELATGTLTIANQVTQGSDIYQDFQFMITADDTLTGGSAFVDAFLSHGENEAINLLTEGEYTIQEILPEGWFLDSIDITGGDGTSNLDTATAIVNWESHENITVSYTNTEGAHITVLKHAEGGENVEFQFVATGTDNRGEVFETQFALNDGEQQSIGEDGYIRPGTYTVEELETAGWFFDQVVSHGEGGTVLDQGPIQVVCVGPGGCIELVYFNSQGGQITIAKNGIGPDGAS